MKQLQSIEGEVKSLSYERELYKNQIQLLVNINRSQEKMISCLQNKSKHPSFISPPEKRHLSKSQASFDSHPFTNYLDGGLSKQSTRHEGKQEQPTCNFNPSLTLDEVQYTSEEERKEESAYFKQEGVPSKIRRVSQI